jgi:hypothetical protein
MLLKTQPNKYDIVSVKLTSGEEIVGGFVEFDDNLVIRKPLALAMTQQGPSLQPYFMTGDTIHDVKEVEFNKNLVVSMIKTHSPFADAYTQATSEVKTAPASQSKLIM